MPLKQQSIYRQDIEHMKTLWCFSVLLEVSMEFLLTLNNFELNELHAVWSKTRHKRGTKPPKGGTKPAAPTYGASVKNSNAGNVQHF